MKADLERALGVLAAFEKWWRLPNDQRTIAAIEEPMRLCLDAISLLREHAEPGPGVSTEHDAYHAERGMMFDIIREWRDESPKQSLGNLCDRLLKAGFRRAAPAPGADAVRSMLLEAYKALAWSYWPEDGTGEEIERIYNEIAKMLPKETAAVREDLGSTAAKESER